MSKSYSVDRWVHAPETQTISITFPSFHYKKTKLFKPFFTLRLYIYAKEQESIRTTKFQTTKFQTTKERSELGSTSMVTRAVVGKYR